MPTLSTHGTVTPVVRRIHLDGRQVVAADVYDGAGGGRTVVLLHGFPQHRAIWRHVAPALAAGGHTVVCLDLPGYGESTPPPDAADVAPFSKRTTARTVVEALRQLGKERFAVVGHDRGGLVALRAALDHPEGVTHLGVLDILPTPDNWDALSGAGGVFAWHLYFLAGPAGLPEQLVGADPRAFYAHFLHTWTKVPDTLDHRARESYIAASSTPAAIHAICQDYRASATVDLTDDLADRDAGNRVQVPTLAMWQDPGDTPLPFDPAAIWSAWTTTLTTATLDCGHFLPEERHHEVAAAIGQLLSVPPPTN